MASGNLGAAFCKLGQYEKAIEFHTKSLNVSHELGDRTGEGMALGNLEVARNQMGVINGVCRIAIIKDCTHFFLIQDKLLRIVLRKRRCVPKRSRTGRVADVLSIRLTQNIYMCVLRTACAEDL